MELTVWLQFAIACFDWGLDPKSPLPPAEDLHSGPYLTQSVIGPQQFIIICQMASKSVERFKQGAQM